MAKVSSDSRFLGTGWSFPPAFNKNSDAMGVVMVSHEQDINESLCILLGTSPGERVMSPAYGCGLKKVVFENFDASVATALKDTIARAILFFEPRITLENIEVDSSDVYQGCIRFCLDYTVRSTNNRSNIVYPFYFEEGTNVRF